MRVRTLLPFLLTVAAVGGLVLGLVLPSSVVPTALGGTAVYDGAVTSDGAGPVQREDFATTGAGNGVAAENQPQPVMEVSALAEGEQAPQFVVVSFDGACRDELFRHYLDLGEETGARFTFFLSGLCLLPEGQADLYDPPRKERGTSAIGFADADLVPQRIVNLTAAYDHGHEIGTHYLGHFCDAEGVGVWTTADWTSEIEQWDMVVNDWAQINGTPDPPNPLPFNASVVRGGRTPCLAGDRDQMYKAFIAAGYTYDASNPGKLQWPRKVAKDRLWDFPLQAVKIVGYGRTAISMDYNFLYVQNGGKVDAPQAGCDKIRKSTYDSYMAALDAVYQGNRAPFFIGNHFNQWACGAYRDALTDFVRDAHAKYPDVRFVTNRDLESWLDAQDPAVLTALQGRPIQSY
ncbi:MAG: hypothetical protein R2737_17280 [Candidatus Nanopelagicales bacterium]